jgi:hypothetical protein
MTMTDDDQRVLHYTVDPNEDAAGEPTEVDDGSFYFTLARPNNDDASDPAYIAPEDRHVLHARRPKTAVLMNMATLDPDKMSLPDMLRITDQFITFALDKPSREYLRAQLDDPDSDWDVDMLVPFINHGKARWLRRPTGRATGSSGSPGSPGTRSPEPAGSEG